MEIPIIMKNTKLYVIIIELQNAYVEINIKSMCKNKIKIVFLL